MSFDAETLYRLFPAIERIRDAELAEGMHGLLTADEINQLKTLGALTVDQQALRNKLLEKAERGPLKALCYIFAEQIGVVEENLSQLYDDLFIETCADWVIPYIGDLIGYKTLHPLGKLQGLERAEVAHTIALRRRKGTAAVLEQLARDVTHWDAHAVEFFQLLATTQHMNHLRPTNFYSPDLRRWEPLSRIGSAFESCAHTVDVRRIQNGKGKYNIPNIGIFLWRLNAYRHTGSPAMKLDDRRWYISPLGHPLQLFHHPLAETEITHLAEPVNVAEPIPRRMLQDYRIRYYGSAENPLLGTEVDNTEPSIVLYIDDIEVPRSKIMVCDLSDKGSDWSHRPKAGCYSIDPVLGRIARASDLPIPTRVNVTYHRGFSADLGGGEYARPFSSEPATIQVRVPEDYQTIQAALNALNGEGEVLITNSGRYEENLVITVSAGRQIILRAVNERFPTIVLPPEGQLTVSGNIDSQFVLDGVMLTARREPLPSSSSPLRLIHVPATSGPVKLSIRHSTLVPGRALDVAGMPLFTDKPAIHIETGDVGIDLQRSIAGAMHLHETTRVNASDSIIDATSADRFAIAGMAGSGAGGEVSLDACTVIGKVRVRSVGVISNSLLIASRDANDTDAAVQADRRQIGCVRFSYLPLDSRVPSRYHCQPDPKGDPNVAPNLAARHFGVAGYCQLAVSTSKLIRQGAEDESEMGAFHYLFSAQREANLRVRLNEYLRVGLETGIFYQS